MAGLRINLPNPPSLVEYGNYRFLIFDAPNDDNLPLYVAELKKQNVHTLIRACDPTYSVEPLRAAGITVLDLPFHDGGAPSDDVVERWLNVLRNAPRDGTKETIGVHCVAGLGRAPVLVAIALIEDGMNSLQAVNLIRDKRKGAINLKQLQWLKSYKPRLRRRNSQCIIM